MSSTAVVYLLWEPSGRGHVDEFLASYREHPAGAEHELVIAACGAPTPEREAAAREWFGDTPLRWESFAGPRIDLFTYRELIDRIPHSEFCFHNSYCRFLADDWLAKILEQLRRDDVGLAGPGGSYESLFKWKLYPPRIHYVLRYKPFPNPHLRTSCFSTKRSVVEQIDWPKITRKSQAWRFESGRAGLSQQVFRLGLEAVVVGRDGVGYGRDEWFEANTFRSGGQSNLLISDLRTDDYAGASDEARDALARDAWGKYDGIAPA
ncbi:MAG: hypothetical protein ACRDKI_06720 [Solirubrobacterales bacterium]